MDVWRLRSAFVAKIFWFARTWNIFIMAAASNYIALSVLTLFIALVINFYINLTTHINFDPVEFSYSPLPEALQSPHQLHRAALHYIRGLNSEIRGPESYLFNKNLLYTGLADGRVIQINLRQLKLLQEEPKEFGAAEETLFYTGNPANSSICDASAATEPICGRPLGLEWDSQGNLIIADAWFGLLSYDFKAKKLSTLTQHVDADHSPILFANGVVVARKTGIIYFTDSSTKYRRTEFLFALLEGKNDGRLLSYNLETKATEVIFNKLAFPNGLLLNAEEDQLILAELGRSRIHTILLTGATETHSHITNSAISAASLPCIPDNLSWINQPEGKYLIGCGGARSQPFALLDFLASKPWLRRFLIYLVPMRLVVAAQPTSGLVLAMKIEEIDRHVVLESWEDRSGEIKFVSGAEQHEGWLYIGTFKGEQNFIPRLLLNN
jgi:sugar lactone lactonase YvrE